MFVFVKYSILILDSREERTFQNLQETCRTDYSGRRTKLWFRDSGNSSKLTGRKLENKLCGLNLSSSSDLLPGLTTGWTQPLNQITERLNMDKQVASAGMGLGEKDGLSVWRGKWETSSWVAIPPAFSGPSPSLTSQSNETSESDLPRLGTMLIIIIPSSQLLLFMILLPLSQ